MLWEHEPQASVSQLFRVLPNFHECFYNSIETRRKCFLFLLENSPRKMTKNKEHLIALFIIKMYILYTAHFTRHKLRHHLYVSIELQKRDYQPISARIFLELFSKYI